MQAPCRGQAAADERIRTLTSVAHVQLGVYELVALQHLAKTAPFVRRFARARGLAEGQVVVVVRFLRVVVLRGRNAAVV